MKFTIEAEGFDAVVKTVDADMGALRRQVEDVSGRVDDIQALADHPDLRAALGRLRDDFTAPVGESAVTWADAVVTEGGNVVVSYRDFDDEVARRADEAEVA